MSPLKSKFFLENAELKSLLNPPQESFLRNWSFGYNKEVILESSKISSLFARHSCWQKAYSDITFLTEILPFFKKYLIADESLSSLSKNYLPHFINQLFEEDKIEKILNPTKDKIEEDFFQKTLEEISALENGKCKLLFVKKDPSDQIFFLFTKKEKKMQFDILGSGKTFSLLLDESFQQSKKIPCKITYLDISKNSYVNKIWLAKLLKSSNQINFNIENLKEVLKSFKSETRFNTMITKCDRSFKSFLNTLLFMDDSNIFTKKNRHRLYLRMELVTLFHLFNRYKDSEIKNKDWIPLKSLFHSSCQNILNDYKKNYLETSEFQECVPYFTKIFQKLETTNPKISTYPLIKGWSMAPYINCELKDLDIKPSMQPPLVKIIEKKKSFVHSYFHFENENDSFQKIHLKIPPINSKEDFLNVLGMLVQNHDRRMIYEIFNPMHFPYSIDDPIWSKFTKEEAIQCMESLNLISKRLADNFLDENLFNWNDKKVLNKIFVFVRYLSLFHFKFTYHLGFYIPNFEENLTHEDVNNFKNLNLYAKFSPKADYNTPEEIHKENRRFIDEQYEFNSVYKCIEYYDNLLIKMIINEKIPKKFSYLYQISRKRNWYRPLKNSFLLAAYFNYELKIQSNEFSSTLFNLTFLKMFPFKTLCGYSYLNDRIKPHGISDEEYSLLSKKCEDEIKRTIGLYTQEAIVDDIEKVTDLIQLEFNKEIKRSRDLIRPYKENIINFEETSFSNEEKKALLLLLRKKYPYSEIFAFIDTFPTLLFEAEVRNYLDNLLFRPRLIKAIKKQPYFFQNLPLKLSYLIENTFENARNNHRYLDLLALLIQWYEKLKLIFLNNENFDIVENFTLETKNYLQYFLRESNSNKEIIPYLHHLLTTELYLLLIMPALSSDHLNQVLFNFIMRNSLSGDPMNHDPQMEEFIKNKHNLILTQLIERKLDNSFYNLVLNQIIQKDEMWEGSFPIFFNKNYRIDFAKCSLVIFNSRQKAGITLPPNVINQPLYKKLFGNLDLKSKKIAREEMYDGTLVYRFKDKNKIPCTIEEKNGVFHFYKTFPESIEPLQAIDLKKLQPEQEDESLFSMVNNMLRERKIPHLPLIFDYNLFINPENPYELFSYTEDNKYAFKLILQKDYWSKISIKNVIDLRKNDDLREVMSGLEIFNPLIDDLSCIEHPSQILIWKHFGQIESIELPRFKLEFSFKDNYLIPTNKKLDKYYVDLKANHTEKQGISFALLLKSFDPSLPNKLIIPESSSFKVNIKTPLPLSGGVAWIIWFAQMMDSQNETNSLFNNNAIENQIPYYLVDISS